MFADAYGQESVQELVLRFYAYQNQGRSFCQRALVEINGHTQLPVPGPTQASATFSLWINHARHFFAHWSPTCIIIGNTASGWIVPKCAELAFPQGLSPEEARALQLLRKATVAGSLPLVQRIIDSDEQSLKW